MTNNKNNNRIGNPKFGVWFGDDDPADHRRVGPWVPEEGVCPPSKSPSPKLLAHWAKRREMREEAALLKPAIQKALQGPVYCTRCGTQIPEATDRTRKCEKCKALPPIKKVPVKYCRKCAGSRTRVDHFKGRPNLDLRSWGGWSTCDGCKGKSERGELAARKEALRQARSK